MHVGNKRGSLPKRILGLLLALVMLFPASPVGSCQRHRF